MKAKWYENIFAANNSHLPNSSPPQSERQSFSILLIPWVFISMFISTNPQLGDSVLSYLPYKVGVIELFYKKVLDEGQG